MGKTPTTLIIMDGFGLTQPGPGNAVSLANTPVLDRLWADHAHTTLSASGLDVGLPEGQMGNSEVGHTNIGGGRVVFQDLPRISRAIEDGTFFANEAYNKAVDDCLQRGPGCTCAACCPTAASTPIFSICTPCWSWPAARGWTGCISTPFWTDVTCPPPAARALWRTAPRPAAVWG